MPPGALGAGLGPQPLGVYPYRTTHWSGRATMGIMWPTWAGLVWPAAHRERSAAGKEDKNCVQGGRLMASAADRVTLLQKESTRLTHYLHALPQEAWSRPSACAQWQVQDVVAHLVGGAELYAGSISRGLRGDTSPPEGRPLTRGGFS